MNKDIIIKIATDFSRIPGARYPEEGDYSGQEFRQNVLHPALKKAIEMNRQYYREVPLGNGYDLKYVAYTHIPRGGNQPMTFFPCDPNCGGY